MVRQLIRDYEDQLAHNAQEIDRLQRRNQHLLDRIGELREMHDENVQSEGEH